MRWEGASVCFRGLRRRKGRRRRRRIFPEDWEREWYNCPRVLHKPTSPFVLDHLHREKTPGHAPPHSDKQP